MDSNHFWNNPLLNPEDWIIFEKDSAGSLFELRISGAGMFWELLNEVLNKTIRPFMLRLTLARCAFLREEGVVPPNRISRMCPRPHG